MIRGQLRIWARHTTYAALLLSVYVQCVSTKIINDPKLTAASRLSPPLLISGLKRRLLSDKRANWNVARFNKYLFQRRFGIVHCNRRFVWNFTELQCLLDQNVKLLDGKRRRGQKRLWCTISFNWFPKLANVQKFGKITNCIFKKNHMSC